MYQIKRYTPEYATQWNAFIAQAKNATFLFHRDFMEYHADRFQDYSLQVFENTKLVAVLPANVVGSTVYSHQGLTYGGLVYRDNERLQSVIEIYKSVLIFLQDQGSLTLQLKQIPTIYNVKPSDEVLYALFLSHAKLTRRDTLSVIDLSKPFKISDLRKRGLKKGIQNQLLIKEEDVFVDFWNLILIPNLQEKFKVKPIHSAQEITALKLKFPKKIRQFNVYKDNELVAGTTIFETDLVAHVQYISSKNGTSDLGNLDFLFHHLITSVFSDKKYFDFGCSNESQGLKLNTGLANWKESFGANTVVHDFYEVQTENHKFLTQYAL